MVLGTVMAVLGLVLGTGGSALVDYYRGSGAVAMWYFGMALTVFGCALVLGASLL